MLLQSLHQNWGFYFVCQVDDGGIGSLDLQQALEWLPYMPGWTVVYLAQESFTNKMIIQYQLPKILLAHSIILKIILEAAVGLDGSPKDTHKGLWTLLL